MLSIVKSFKEWDVTMRYEQIHDFCLSVSKALPNNICNVSSSLEVSNLELKMSHQRYQDPLTNMYQTFVAA